MKLSQLLLYVGIAIVTFWVLGLIIKLAGFLFEIGLVVGLILIVAGLVSRYYDIKRHQS